MKNITLRSCVVCYQEKMKWCKHKKWRKILWAMHFESSQDGGWTINFTLCILKILKRKRSFLLFLAYNIYISRRERHKVAVAKQVAKQPTWFSIPFSYLEIDFFFAFDDFGAPNILAPPTFCRPTGARAPMPPLARPPLNETRVYEKPH